MNKKDPGPIAALLAVLCFGAVLEAAANGRQNTDPFYLKSLKDGESFYQAKRYKEAADSLEIAAFGLFGNKDALARARVFLGLSYAGLNERAKAERNIKTAAAILGPEGWPRFDLPESVKTDLSKILRILKIDLLPAAPSANPKAAEAALPDKAKAPETPPVNAAVPKPDADSGSRNRAALKEEIRQAPRRPDSYFELARLEAAAGDAAAAKAALNKLLENNPAEIRGYLQLGRIAFSERNWKEAEKHLEKFLALKDSLTIDRRLVVEAQAVLALSAYLRGDVNKTLAALGNAPELADPAVRDGLSLDAADKERLVQLLRRLAK
jgi:hypothetical protein